MTLKKIKRTNAPRTCLYCGQKLKQNKQWRERDLTAAEFATFHDASGAQLDERKWPRIDGFKVRWILKADKSHPPRCMLIVPLDNDYGMWSGFFCTNACAGYFGQAAARNNFRLQPSSQE